MKRFATIWLDGCSGCHMSFLDTDERIIDLAQHIEVLYGPTVDYKEFPDNVDITLVEGAVSTEEDLKKIKEIRAKTKLLIAFGDCAVTGNVSAMKNLFGTDAVLRRVYGSVESAPDEVVPKLLDRVMPIHEVIKVDFFLQGCPPPADAIFYALSEVVNDRIPDINELTRFGK